MKKTIEAILWILAIIAIGLLIRSRCSTISSGQLKRATEFCADKGGIDIIITTTFKLNVAVCADDDRKFIEMK